MKRHTKKTCLAAVLLLFTVLLSGCISGSVSELYALPRLPEDYQKLQKKIEEVLAQGSAESAAPLTGELSQPVQLQDLDGDGVQEAIVFFRVNGAERPLKIYIYREVEDDYQVAGIVEGSGQAINCVAYENVDDTPEKEIVVSWQISEKLYSLAVYSIAHDQVLELIRADDYTDFCVFDLDMDHQNEVIVLMEDNGVNRVDFYDFNSVLELQSTALLSRNTTAPVENGMTIGLLRDRIPAVFVPSYYSENGRVTDILAWKDGRIQNITLDPETMESTSTVRWYNQVAGTDINGDGIMELPEPYALPDPKQTTAAVNFWAFRWRQFDIDGNPIPVFTTYHNERDGWYFILPERWKGKVSLSRSDQSGGSERAVIFSHWEEDSGKEPEPFLIIYRLIGDNRVRRASLPDRFRLYPLQGDESDVIYAAKLLDSEWDSGLTEDDVRAAFSPIPGN